MSIVKAYIREIVHLPGNQVKSSTVISSDRPFTRQYALYVLDEEGYDLHYRDIENVEDWPNVLRVDELSAKWQQIIELGGIASDELINGLLDASSFYVRTAYGNPVQYSYGSVESALAVLSELHRTEGSLSEFIVEDLGVHEYWRFCINWGSFLDKAFRTLPDGVVFTEYIGLFGDWLQDPSKEFNHKAEALLHENYTIVARWLQAK